jgi:hypothetical protein
MAPRPPIGCRAGISIICLALATSIMACNRKIDRAKADTLAAANLQQYAKDEGMKADLFTRPDVGEQEGKWLYTYEYRASPKQSVAVVVFADGRVELSRMLAEVR